MKNITVLLSTYNGEKFLVEQINSLLEQNGVNITIFVRDDGSTDNTKHILSEFESENILTWYEGENLGPAKSFIDLVHRSPDSDFYAYCDQDDIWYENKLLTAITKIRKYDMNEISLYTSTYDVVDVNLNFINKRDMKFDQGLTLPQTIVGKSPSGCTMVFNKKLRDKIKEYSPENIRMHDFWTLLIAEAFHGNIIKDDTSQLMYRQHSNNTVGYGKSFFVRFVRLLKSVIYRKNERKKQVDSLYYGYKNSLPEDSLNIIKCVVNYKKSLLNRFKLIFNKKFYSSSYNRNILFFVSVLLGLF
jgi:rhamnosyltransferase